MFATLLGPLPVPADARGAEGRLAAVIAAQVEAGLEPVTDGLLDVTPPSADEIVARWRETASVAAAVAAKQALVGPFTVGTRATATERDRVTLEAAEALATVIAALGAAGCPLVEIHEPAGIGIATDDKRALFHEACRLALAGAGSIHASLALVGGNADHLGPALFDLPFASFALDLRAGPDNWRLVAAAPQDRGIVVGALPVDDPADEGPELPVWAAHYAASTAGRGLDRVGLAPAGSLAHLPWDVAVRKMRRLGEAARIAARRSFAEIAPDLDPRAAGMRSAALGRYVPPRPRKPPGR